MTMKSWLAGLAAVGVALAVPAAASASAQLTHQGGGKKVTSRTWAGYVALADKGTKFRYVAAQMTIAWPTCPGFGPGDSALFYQSAGLGGYNGGTAMQIGLREICAPALGYGGYTEFDAFYRDASGQHDFLSCLPALNPCPRGPNPGDKVQLSVYYNGTSYRLLYVDVTARVHRKFYVRCSTCRNNSAEVINQGDYQAPGPPVHAMTVDFFGIRVTSADGTHGTIAAQPRHWTSTKIIMVDSASRDLAVPSALLRQGRAFHLDVSAPKGCGC
ncbi:MAG TPA: hypothetical protein VGI66_14435 [Streptosporangiaceae bacterium]|jgi:hypothetical protein